MTDLYVVMKAAHQRMDDRYDYRAIEIYSTYKQAQEVCKQKTGLLNKASVDYYFIYEVPFVS